MRTQKIYSINKGACRDIRTAINETLQKISEELGITFHAGNASYDDNSVTFKVQCTLEGVDKAEEDFKQYAHMFNLPEDAYGKTFIMRGERYTLCGLKPNSPKYPILGRGANGKRYKFQERAVADLKKRPTVVEFDPKTTQNLRGIGDVGV